MFILNKRYLLRINERIHSVLNNLNEAIRCLFTGHHFETHHKFNAIEILHDAGVF